MSTLLDRQLELDGLVKMGPQTDYIVSRFEFGPAEIRTSDVPMPRGDGVRFGRDYRGGRTVALDLTVNKTNSVAATTAASKLEKAWLGDTVRAEPGAVSQLRYNYAGRNRVIFGRGRAFATDNTLYNAGRIDVTADFATVDHRTYSDDVYYHTISIAPASAGGFTLPLTFPAFGSGTGTAEGDVFIEGDDNTWLMATISGPIVNPQIEVVGFWTATLQDTLLEGQSVTIDPRPWVRTVRRNDGANMAGKFSASTPRLSQMALSPGSHEIVLRGTSVTNTASLTVSWRSAFLSL